MTLFKKLLIANRGEIAVRIARTCARLGIKTVGVYSDADRTAMHVRACDEAYHIGPPPASESYLRGDKIIEVARRASCEAIHPGYGFLSENARFAQGVIDAGIAWVGPPPEAITLMGSKIESKRLAERSGVPVVPGYFGDDQSPETLAKEAERIGYPLLVKASAGGGGKGMRVVEKPAMLREALEGAQREALAAFGDSGVMLERYLTEPRHIEVQVLGDRHGHLIHLGERDCSIQRRHQKVVEESPSPAIGDEIRARITASALALAKAAGYANAGTVEFIFQQGKYYFLEMNTRLQVEHPVTEEALSLDLVEAQIRVAAGEELPIKQEDVGFKRHAIEVRLYAEDPERGFLPSTGTLRGFGGPHKVRIDTGVAEGDNITPYYDPMLAKIIASGDSRQEALRALREDLGNFTVEGVKTNIDFLRWLAAHPQFESGDFSTRFIERYYTPGAHVEAPLEVVLAAATVRLLAPAPSALSLDHTAGKVWQTIPWRQARQNMNTQIIAEGRLYGVTFSELLEQPGCWSVRVVNGESTLFDTALRVELPGHAAFGYSFSGLPDAIHLRSPAFGSDCMVEYAPGSGALWVRFGGRSYLVRTAPPLSTETLATTIHVRDEDTLESPMPGKVLKVLAEAGDVVGEDQPLVIIEAMKMEFTVRAPHDGRVAIVHYKEGDQVAVGDVLVEMEK